MTDATHSEASTRERLLATAAKLFRRKGYHAVGLTELLAEAKAPKGSLYHHFPNGKPDLALAAANWASDHMRSVLDDSFRKAASFEDGATTLCHKLAKLFDLTGQQDGCPISSILVGDSTNAAFQGQAQTLYATWSDDVVAHAKRLGVPEAEAKRQVEHLFLLLQGAWLMARARRSSDVLRALPGYL